MLNASRRKSTRVILNLVQDPFIHSSSGRAARWTLKQVQGDAYTQTARVIQHDSECPNQKGQRFPSGPHVTPIDQLSDRAVARFADGFNVFAHALDGVAGRCQQRG